MLKGLVHEIAMLAIVVSTVAATLILCMEKWGWLEWWDVHHSHRFGRACHFCLGFWLCLAMCLAFITYTGATWWLLISAFMGASITRQLIRV
ncbi:hypothetical protein [Rufibacter quisquiliarum]|uniref:DUF1360 domain-containing protein n=1 Tax=Rufibacter quisquiliarum TaxID=1549639 RepID=A0A839GHG6_9BACT|nr:hypothetical protein [Rufibacter quisquiliarum]MBA9078322.1 hypothetical protein [Rufibacter quisquiliarum]